MKNSMVLMLVLALVISGVAHAGLLGDPIKGSLYKYGVNIFTDSPVTVVDTGEEFHGLFFIYEDEHGVRSRVEAFADFDDDTVYLGFQHVAGDLGSSFGCCPNLTFTFTDLDMDGGASPITGLNLLARQGNDNFTFSYTANSITVICDTLGLGPGAEESITLEILTGPIPEPPIIYVDMDASGANNGSSWADAYNSLQDALTACPRRCEIRVAQGIYKPDQGQGITPGDMTATFQLKNCVAIKGGYAGFDAPDPNARDIELYETILSGDLNGNDDGFANNSENSYHVVTGSRTIETAVLDGFTITGGNANGQGLGLWGYPVHQDRGGGLYNYYGSPTVTNCTFTANTALAYGAGMHNRSGSPTLTNCTFIGNSAWYYGGGMANNQNSSPTLTNCTFRGNSVGEGGGGMWNRWRSNPWLKNCTFNGNSARRHAGGILIDESRPTLTNCTFAANSANNGNALACDSQQQSYPSNVQLTNCILWDGGNEIWNNDNSVITITYSDIQGGWEGEGNIDADPCFVSPGYWDANGLWVEGDYHLLEDSPCIDVGDPNYVAEPNTTTLQRLK